MTRSSRIKTPLPLRPTGIGMSEDKLGGTTRPRIELPKRLWLIIKGVAPWKGMSPSGLVQQILQNYVDDHVTFVVDGERIEVKEVV